MSDPDPPDSGAAGDPGEHGSDEHRQDHGGHDHREHHRHMADDFRRRFWASLVLTVPVLALSRTIHGWLGLGDRLDFPARAYVQLAFAAVVFAYGGKPFLAGLAGELRKRQPGMMTLIGTAISVAMAYSTAVVLGVTGESVFFWELATLIDLMLLGHWIEMRSVLSAGSALEELARQMPSQAHRLTGEGDRTEDVPVSQLAEGDRVRVRPGEKMPADGEIDDGRSTFDESSVTGESKPIEKGPGDSVVAGVVNGASAVTVTVRKAGEDTYLSQVVSMVRQAQQARSNTQNLADRAARWLTVLALSAGAATFLAWRLAGARTDYSLERSVTVMVITCPHALGLAIPLVVAVSTTLAARRGLLIRDRNALERTVGLDAVIFDKTGTLTEGRFAVTDAIPLAGDADADEVLRLAAAVEGSSEHSIARGIVSAADEKDLDRPGAEGFEAIPGKGARATVDGRELLTVSPSYLEERGLEIDSDRVDRRRAEGMTVVFLLEGDRPVGAIALDDVVRDSARTAVDELRSMGLDVLLVTGDAEPVARRVAEELGIDETFAEVLPDAKVEIVRDVRSEGRRVAMVGDGINDAAALAEADVGIAIGAGTDVAIDSADVVLVESDPGDVLAVVRLARGSYRKMIQNLLWATGYNAVTIPLAAGALAWAGVVLSPAAGAIIMSLSTVIVAINARLLGLPS
jgi:Cu2+-exporting ATPase